LYPSVIRNPVNSAGIPAVTSSFRLDHRACSPRQQVLQPVRPAVPGRLGNRPAIMIVQLHQQPAHHLAAARLPPGKAPGHPSQQIRQQRGPGIIRYRGSSDCRILIVSQTHHDRGSRTSPWSSDLRQQPHDHELQLPYQPELKVQTSADVGASRKAPPRE
jgi:hypothetical protein